MEIPKEFYTTATLYTLTGSATAVWIITSVIGYVIELKDGKKLKKWLGLILSLALALIGASQLPDRTSGTWVVAVVNGFLIYLTAVGANTIVGQGGEIPPGGGPPAPVRETAAKRRKDRGGFTERWW
jgi:thiol:disulfide interchange protein